MEALTEDFSSPSVLPKRGGGGGGEMGWASSFFQNMVL